MKKQKEDNKKKDTANYSTLVIDNVKYKTILTRKYSDRKPYVETNPRLLTAFIPGTVTSIFVKEGQNVLKGDNLVIFEAMKMLNEIKAPYDTVVKTVMVNIGDRVVRNQGLIELE